LCLFSNLRWPVLYKSRRGPDAKRRPASFAFFGQFLVCVPVAPNGSFKRFAGIFFKAAVCPVSLPAGLVKKKKKKILGENSVKDLDD
jgi:hypothetical protein